MRVTKSVSSHILWLLLKFSMFQYNDRMRAGIQVFTDCHHILDDCVTQPSISSSRDMWPSPTSCSLYSHVWRAHQMRQSFLPYLDMDSEFFLRQCCEPQLVVQGSNQFVIGGSIIIDLCTLFNSSGILFLSLFWDSQSFRVW